MTQAATADKRYFLLPHGWLTFSSCITVCPSCRTWLLEDGGHSAFSDAFSH